MAVSSASPSTRWRPSVDSRFTRISTKTSVPESATRVADLRAGMRLARERASHQSTDQIAGHVAAPVHGVVLSRLAASEVGRAAPSVSRGAHSASSGGRSSNVASTRSNPGRTCCFVPVSKNSVTVKLRSPDVWLKIRTTQGSPT